MSNNITESTKYSFLVLGGCGFIGRHLVEYLICSQIAFKVRVADKLPPQVCWLNKRHKETFSNPLVEFVSANLINATSCRKAFTLSDNEEFDFAINLAAQTRLGQEDAVYKEGILQLSINCAREAAHRGVKLVEVTGGQLVYSKNEAISEDDVVDSTSSDANTSCSTKVDALSLIDKYKSQVEEELRNNIKDLDYVIVRPALVYGIGDKTFITPRITIGAIYKHLNETMQLLWNRELKMNSVHVTDVCRAIKFLCDNWSLTNKQVYNLVDKGDTTEGSLTDLISLCFNVKNKYLGSTMSLIAVKSNGLEFILDEINDKHMSAWSSLCTSHNIRNTPINPYLFAESMREKDFYLKGNNLEKLGFSYHIPVMTKETIMDIINDYVEMKLFPQLLS